MAGKSLYMVFTDGAARGNPGPAASGYAVFGPDGTLIEKDAKTIGKRTNNEAEYEALIWAIRCTMAITRGEVRFHSDSELMVKQVSGRYQVRKEHLKPLVETVRRESSAFSGFRLVHVPREDERIQLVDAMVNDELDRQGF